MSYFEFAIRLQMLNCLRGMPESEAVASFNTEICPLGMNFKCYRSGMHLTVSYMGRHIELE
jgi:hypothetical protein